MLVCPRCGAGNEDGASACASCSAKLEGSGARASSGDPDQLIGKIINGKYEVLEILGTGGMGVVYKVRHLLLQNKNIFALKILRPRFSSQSNFHQRFLREVEIAMGLTHENIIQIRDFGVTEEKRLFYTMDYFPGQSLKSLIEKEGAISPRRVIAISRQILMALAEAHKRGIVHRDLKPDNILIESTPAEGDRVRILDFGIAKVMVGEGENDDNGLTRGAVIGTPKYMSPEQAGGENIDGRSDLYSFGVILYELLSGRVPFAGGTARSILLSHLTVPPRSFRDVRPDLKLPSQLEDTVYRLMEKEREARPASAAHVLALLDSVSRRSGIAGAAGLARSAARVLLASAALAGAGAALYTWLGPPGAEPGNEAHALEGPAAALPPSPLPAPPPEPEKTTAAEKPPPVKLRCAVCGAVYAFGEKVADMCHGEPLEPVE